MISDWAYLFFIGEARWDNNSWFFSDFWNDIFDGQPASESVTSGVKKWNFQHFHFSSKNTHVYTQIERLDETNTELQTKLKLDNSTKSYDMKWWYGFHDLLKKLTQYAFIWICEKQINIQLQNRQYMIYYKKKAKIKWMCPIINM